MKTWIEMILMLLTLFPSSSSIEPYQLDSIRQRMKFPTYSPLPKAPTKVFVANTLPINTIKEKNLLPSCLTLVYKKRTQRGSVSGLYF